MAASVALNLVAVAWAVAALPASPPAGPASRLVATTFASCDTLFGHGRLDSLQRRLDAIVAASPRDSGLAIVAGSYQALALALGGRGARAEPLSRRALRYARATRDTALLCRSLQGLVLSRLFTEPESVRDTVLRLIGVARAARLHRFEGQALMNLAYLDVLVGHAEASRRGYARALELLEPALDPVPRRIARVGLGRALTELGRDEEARAVYIALIRECRQQSDVYDEAAALNNLAQSELETGDPSNAIPYLERARELQVRVGARTEWFDTSINLANALIRLGRYTEAARLFETMRDTLGWTPSPDRQVDVLVGLARVRELEGRPGAARTLVLRAWAIADSTSFLPSRDLVTAYALLRAADGHANEAVRLLDDWVVRRPKGLSRDEDQRVASTAAQILARDGRLDEALARWHRILSGLDSLHAGGLDGRAEVLAAMARAHLRRGQVTRAREEALSAIASWERARAAVQSLEWREALTNPADPEGGGLVSVLLACAPAEDQGTRERAAFATLQRLKARTLVDRGSGAPGSRAADFAGRPQGPLRDGEVALDVYPEHDTVFVFAVSRTGLRVVRLGNAPALREQFERYRDLLLSPDPGDQELAEHAAAELGRTVWGPLAAWIADARTVLVSGGGFADGIPWALLDLPGTGAPGFERIEFASIPSLRALAVARLAGERTTTATLTVLAVPRDAAGRELPGVASESRWLTSRYAPARVWAPGTREQAARGLGTLAPHGCLHVAAHFADDREDPWRSGLLIGDPTRDDAYLRARDLTGQRFPARLVVLSGCSSAGVHVRGLEGDRGLASAFLAAGAQAVLGTLWPVSDAASAEFTRRFYRSVEGGGGVATALARTQREMREAGRPTSDWAGFILLGDPGCVPKLQRRSMIP